MFYFDQELWQQFVYWIQFIAAIVTILAAPWAFGLLQRLLRKRVVAKAQTEWQDFPGQGYQWEVQLTNQTLKLENHVIYVFPASRGNKVNSIWVAHPNNRLLETATSVRSGKGVIEVSVWPTKRKISVRVRTEAPDLIEFYSEGQEIYSDLKYPFFGGKNELFGQISLKDMSRIQVRHYLLTVAHLRLLSLIVYASLVTCVMLLRILQLGFYP